MHVVVKEFVESLEQLFGREFKLAAVRTLDDLSKEGVKLLRHTSVKSGSLGVPFTVREFWITKNLDELLESILHDDLVVIALKNVFKDTVQVGESLRRLVTHDLRRAQVGKLAQERLSGLDLGGVIQSENTENVASLESCTWLLDEVHHTILLSNQRHVHLHDLDFGEWLSLLDVLAVLDGELDKLARARRAELSRVVLLLEQTGLAVDAKTSSANFFLPVDIVRLAA